jgi:DNA-binding response OmpR family regulator
MKKILLIEDDAFLSDIYTTKLRESGLNVDVISDGEEALRKVKEQKYDLVLLDIVLPKMDGWDILKAIRSQPGLRDLKVIIISNLSQKEEIDKGLSLGALKYLVKAHYTPSEMLEEINEALK